MVAKIVLLIINCLGLVHSFPQIIDDIKSPQQENSHLAQTSVQTIIIKQDEGNSYCDIFHYQIF